MLFATALGTVALALAAHQLKRRRRRKKQIAPDKCGFKPGGITVPILPTRRVSSVKKGWPRKKGKIPKEVVQGAWEGVGRGRQSRLWSAWMRNEVGILKGSAVSSPQGLGAKGETLSSQSSGTKGVLMFSLRFAVPILFPGGSL